jgi:hypothetical protein
MSDRREVLAAHWKGNQREYDSPPKLVIQRVGQEIGGVDSVRGFKTLELLSHRSRPHVGGDQRQAGGFSSKRALLLAR